MTGMIQGGWEFVWAVYGITWAALVWYAIRLRAMERAQ
jgi:Na+/proline symporter